MGETSEGERLALLDSADLGMAEGAYLKAAARQHEAQLAHERAANLHEHRAISLAELQRREAEMKTAQADAREASHRLKLLGVPDQDIQRLERERTIRSDVAIRAPFAGRVILRNITRGEVVETSRNCFTIADLSGSVGGGQRAGKRRALHSSERDGACGGGSVSPRRVLRAHDLYQRCVGSGDPDHAGFV